jgi:tetratricopeptide (TPR) repeat protein
MAKIGRNDPCPCGSGKKYKKCCLARDEARIAAQTQRPEPEAATPTLVEDPLDELSNSVVDLIEQKRFDEALAVCEQLQREYPEVIDGLERFAMVHEARGDWALAVSYYRRALAFTEQPDQRDGFDDDARADLRERLAHAEAHAAAV